MYMRLLSKYMLEIQNNTCAYRRLCGRQNSPVLQRDYSRRIASSGRPAQIRNYTGAYTVEVYDADPAAALSGCRREFVTVRRCNSGFLENLFGAIFRFSEKETLTIQAMQNCFNIER